MGQEALIGKVGEEVQKLCEAAKETIAGTASAHDVVAHMDKDERKWQIPIEPRGPSPLLVANGTLATSLQGVDIAVINATAGPSGSVGEGMALSTDAHRQTTSNCEPALAPRVMAHPCKTVVLHRV